MGNVPSHHLRIWNELTQIENDATRLKMVETLLIVPEYVQALKRVGLFGDVAVWTTAVKRGQWAEWPQYAPPAAAPTRPKVAPNTREKVSNAITKTAPARKAMDYLHEAYDLLGLSDDEPLTLEVLKAGYKRRAILVHPDKPGGNAEDFDALTKAYLYLQEVYNKLIPKAARKDTSTPVTMAQAKKYRNDPSLPVFDDGSEGISLVVRDPNAPVTRAPAQAESAPVLLNPKKLDMNVFNQLFEQNRLPDPEHDDGYGDWLTSQEASEQKKGSGSLRGKFNLDVFNKTFESDASASTAGKKNTIVKYNSPDALILSPTAVVLGGEKPSEYTSPAGAGLQYTDLKAAYSTRTTFSQDVSNVKVGSKSIAQAKAEREKDPGPVSPEEQKHLEDLRLRAEQMERARVMRLSSRDADAGLYTEKLKQRLLITEKPVQ
jgi:curved DNA-binding protein CbpA